MGFAARFASAAELGAPALKPEIPKTWDDAAMATLNLPLANPAASPKQIPVDYES